MHSGANKMGSVSSLSRWMILGAASAILLLGIWIFRDSFINKRAPFSHGTLQHGVVHYDRLRAQRGYYNVVNTYVNQDDCTVMDMDGQIVFDFPHAFCYFFRDHSLLLLTGGDSALYDPTGQLVWSLYTGMHHDFDVTDDENEIFYVENAPAKLEGKPANSDLVQGLNRRGESIFRWRFNDHVDEIRKILGRDLEIKSERGEVLSTPSHLNSIQILRTNPLSELHPEFQPGNLLVSDFNNRFLFILERASGRIVWSHVFRNYQMKRGSVIEQDGAHTARMLPSGNILYFHNLEKYDYASTRFSSVDELDPVRHEIVRRYTTDPATAMESAIWGAAFRLDNGNTLVTHSVGGTAIEVTPDGRIVWEWINPKRDPGGIAFPVYQVKRVAKELVDPVIRIWKSKD